MHVEQKQEEPNHAWIIQHDSGEVVGEAEFAQAQGRKDVAENRVARLDRKHV